MKFPNFFTFVKAMWRFWKRPEVAPQAVQDVRAARCRLCPYEEQGQCQKCTCVVDFKVILATEFCPDKRWGEYFSARSTGL